jgi:transcriptional regulator with XRE-family HTH domain
MNKELAKSIGLAARQARKQLQLTQEDAAERIDVSVEFYARIERGTSLPSILTFARIVSALGVSADALLGRHPAFVQAGPAWTPQQADESPEIRRLVRRLRKANPSALRLVSLLLRELETAPASNEQLAAAIEGAPDTTERTVSGHADDIQLAAMAAS